MPELPEVETVRRQLEATVLSKKIKEVEVLEKKIVRGDEDFERSLLGSSFLKIDRIGKLLIFHTSKKGEFLLAHLKMTGKFLLKERREDFDKHTHIIWKLSAKEWLGFQDVRKFGYVVRAGQAEVETAKSKFGIEPLTPDFTFENFEKIFIGRKTNIKALLLNQKLIAGLGNIYVDEVLFRAKVHPERRVDTLGKKEQKEIFKAIEKVIRGAIEKGGTTFIDFAHTDGKAGSYVDDLKVFARRGKHCLRCKEKIQKTRVAGRGTHLCPNCQV